MNIEKKVVVIGVKRVQFENGGDKVEGTQVYYHETDSANEMDVKGFIPNKAWLPLSEFENFKEVVYPFIASAIVDVDLTKGKLKIKGFKAFETNIKK